METSSLPAVTIQSPSGEFRARIAIEIADDDAARQQGLMNRASVPDGTGMLFVFPDSQERTFWMKNVLIPLDMLFIDASGSIVSIAQNVRACEADPCPVISSERPARYVLELAGGATSRLGLERGGIVELHGVGPARN